MSRRLLLPLLLLLAAPAAAGADTVLTLQSSIQGLKDQPQPGPVKVWIDGDKLRRDEGETSYVLRMWDPLESTCRHASLSIL